MTDAEKDQRADSAHVCYLKTQQSIGGQLCVAMAMIHGIHGERGGMVGMEQYP